MQTYSKNPVQQKIIDTLLNADPKQINFKDPHWWDSTNVHLGFKGGDDVYDIANYIAALKKTIKILEEEELKPRVEFIEEKTCEEWVEAAMSDWEGEIKDIYNPAK